MGSLRGAETHTRSVLKAISWRTLGTLDTFAISWLLTGRVEIAGSIARRIVTDGSPGELITQGDRMGMIRFGSRVDLFLAPQAAIKVSLGDNVHAGLTVLAELPA